MKTFTRNNTILWSMIAGILTVIAILWMNEFTQLQYYFGGNLNVANWREPALETAFVLLVAVPVLILTRRLLSRLHYLEGFLSVCAWCKKVDHNGQWIPMAEFFESKFETETTHGICQSCADEITAKIKKRENPTAALQP